MMGSSAPTAFLERRYGFNASFIEEMQAASSDARDTIESISKNIAYDTVEVTDCDSSSDANQWFFIKSTGHLRSKSTRKCLTAQWQTTASGNPPTIAVALKGADCVLSETQTMVQRWVVSSYSQSSTGGHLTSEIKLGYGAHSTHPWCLWGASSSAGSTGSLQLARCDSTSMGSMHKSWRIHNEETPHSWNFCSSYDETTGCVNHQGLNSDSTPNSNPGAGRVCEGEIRIGHAESPEDWAQPVMDPMLFAQAPQNLGCDLNILRSHAVVDPIQVSGGQTKQCQCRPDLTNGPATATPRAAEASSNTTMIIIICASVGAVAAGGGGFWYYKKTQGAEGAEAGEFEEEGEWEEEEYEEGEYEEEEEEGY